MAKLTEDDMRIIRAYADHGMNCIQTARAMRYDRRTIYYHFDKVRAITGKDPCNFYELHELLKMFEKGEIDFGRSHSD